MAESVKRFEVGKTYGSKDAFPGRFKIVSRTAKTVRIRYLDKSVVWEDEKERNCRVTVAAGEERIHPDGSYYAHAPIYGVKSKTIYT